MDHERAPDSKGETGQDDGLAAALAGSRAGGDKADAYLDEATRLARLKIAQLEDERHFEPFAHFSTIMKAAFESAVALLIIAILVASGSAIWSAANDTSLVIEPFSVPADMAVRGMSGRVVAAALQDKLAALQAQTGSMRAADSYQNNWGDEIEVQIPETGVSLGELNRYLHRWLGHQTRISGEVYEDGGKLVVAARVGAEPARRFTGKGGKLDMLVQKAAEAVYAKTQPYRYAVYLQYANRGKEAEAAYRSLIANGLARDRAWAYVGLGALMQSRGNLKAARRDFDAALEIRPDFLMAQLDRSGLESELQHLEAAYQGEKTLDETASRNRESDIDAKAMPTTILGNRISLALDNGDYREGLALDRKVEALPDYGGSLANAWRADMVFYAYLHDPGGVKHSLAAMPPARNPIEKVNRNASHFVAEAVIGNWAQVLAMAPKLKTAMAPFNDATAPFIDEVVPSLTAAALAMTGHRKEADAMIAPMPADCDTCTRSRIRIAIAEGDWKTAEHWARHLIARIPSLPYGHSDLGRVFLAEGQYSEAAKQFELAHRKSPHYADALEGWGEALMGMKRSDLALRKFATANKDAPHWGRLHLEWGEALYWTGNRAEAKKQFRQAAGLQLTGQEKSIAARWEHQA